MFSVILVAALILLACLYSFFKQSNNSHFPGPWNLPIVGSLYLLDEKEPHISLTKLSQKYGSIYRLKLGTVNMVVVADAKLLKKILLKDETLARPPLYYFDLFFKGKGIAFANGDLWKDQRRFVSNYLRMSGAAKASSKKQVFEEQSRVSMETFLQHIRRQGDEVICNASEAISQYVSRIASSLFLGKSQSYDDKKEEVLLKHFSKILKFGAMSGAINFLPLLRFLPNFKQPLSLLTNTHEEIDSILNEYIAEATQNDSFNLIQNFFQQKLKSKNDIYTNDQLRCLLFDLFIASNETTSTSIWWNVLYLSAYPEMQDKVRKEITDVLQGREPEFDDLAHLPYTEATMAEVARIRTVVPMAAIHCTTGDVGIENFTIPKGTCIMPLLWAIHMDPQIWKEPEVFNPERFLNDEGKFFQPEAFLPFTIGKRMCPGNELARMMVFIFVVKLLQNFRIFTPGSVDLSGYCGATFMPKPQDTVFGKI